MNKPIASLSLDLDDQWTYLKTHGNPEWSSYPSYLDYAVPRILDFLEERNTKITFFIVAQDAVFEQNMSVLAEIAKKGHDIGNHTFHHDPWLHLYTEEEINEELEKAEQYIQKVTGVKPNGFRGPGFSFSNTVLQVLVKRGYSYDASTFPNILNPLARTYFLWTSNLNRKERAQRKGLFGTWKDGFRPNKPFEWKTGNQYMLEIPVTTMPIFKVPIHASYILFLSNYSEGLARLYFKFALFLCRLTNTAPSILLHPLDFIGCDDTEALSFFPAMRMTSRKKINVMNDMFRILNSQFEVLTMSEFADLTKSKTRLKQKEISQ